MLSNPLPVATCSPTLATYLQNAKDNFLKDAQESPESAKKWTVVMGNEAGDLDSIASAIGYAWFLSESKRESAIPLIQIAKEDFTLRAENLYALELAGIPNPQETLLSASDILDFKPFPTDKFVLVDHNRLGSQYSEGNPQAKVTGVVDHHEDEGLYKDTATPRLIKPSGSASSLVASLLPSELPAELSTLLLSAIVIDTQGLKPGGKATEDDRQAALSLASNTTLSISTSSFSASSVHEIQPIKDLSEQLSKKKVDLSHLGGWDLLRRDYKEYTHTLPWAEGQPTIKVGLATVPVQLKVWGSKGNLETESLAWMSKRGLTILGVLTTFRSEKKIKKKAGGKHKREMAWIILEPSETPGVKLDTAQLADRLWTGIEGSEELQAKVHKKFWFGKSDTSDNLPSNAKIRVYKQKNADATRKAVAPLIKAILEDSASSSNQAKL
ncbi:DHH phosphoesterase [Coprinopsis marcescibilis]|uniref:DHH phosphoesterase n=1 Tax=Coprinopsis marcescibilis TaxID=230819 RepID=A0A5C3LC39_COPMA|nr:DHH phosphoesterase [Coprinopsis marcescibilis]